MSELANQRMSRQTEHASRITPTKAHFGTKTAALKSTSSLPRREMGEHHPEEARAEIGRFYPPRRRPDSCGLPLGANDPLPEPGVRRGDSVDRTVLAGEEGQQAHRLPAVTSSVPVGGGKGGVNFELLENAEAIRAAGFDPDAGTVSGVTPATRSAGR